MRFLAAPASALSAGDMQPRQQKARGEIRHVASAMADGLSGGLTFRELFNLQHGLNRLWRTSEYVQSYLDGTVLHAQGPRLPDGRAIAVAYIR